MARPKAPKDFKKSPDSPFVFLYDGEQYEMQSIGRLSSDEMEVIAELPEYKQLRALANALADERTAALIGSMPMAEAGDLFEAWSEHSGITVGES